MQFSASDETKEACQSVKTQILSRRSVTYIFICHRWICREQNVRRCVDATDSLDDAQRHVSLPKSRSIELSKSFHSFCTRFARCLSAAAAFVKRLKVQSAEYLMQSGLTCHSVTRLQMEKVNLKFRYPRSCQFEFLN